MTRMTTLSRWFGIVILASNAGVIGCGAATEGPDTSSHWLSACRGDDACEDGQACLCGVCTKACDRTNDCRALDDDARCLEVKDCSAEAVCALESTFQGDTESQNTSESTSSTNEPNSDTATSSTDQESSTFVPDGCEFLRDQATTSPECKSSQGQCEQVKSEQTERSFILSLYNYYLDENGNEVTYTEDEVTHRQQCLFDMARGFGLDAELTGGDVTVTGSWPEVEPVARAATRYYVQCADCEYCYALDETDCNDDAFCYAQMGRLTDLVQECLEPDSFFECLPSNVGCNAAVMFGELGDECWWFSSICPTQKPLSEEADACLAQGHDLGELYGFEACGEPMECYSPFENPDLAFSEGSVGCSCDYEFGAQVCLLLAYACRDGRWVAEQDGICFDSTDSNCGATFDTLEQCFETYAGCFEREEGGFCGVDTRPDAQQPVSEEQCVTLGGVVVEQPKPYGSRWIEIDEKRYCESAPEAVSSAFCEAASGVLQCDLPDAGSNCPDGYRSIVDVNDCESEQPGTCCFR